MSHGFCLSSEKSSPTASGRLNGATARRLCGPASTSGLLTSRHLASTALRDRYVSVTFWQGPIVLDGFVVDLWRGFTLSLLRTVPAG